VILPPLLVDALQMDCAEKLTVIPNQKEAAEEERTWNVWMDNGWSSQGHNGRMRPIINGIVAVWVQLMVLVGYNG
jgi:hypothetical protein